MNKVVTINLNGRAYQLEEAGFDALRAYLDEAGVRLADDPGKAEIIADLEQAIAEKCDKALNHFKTVVATEDIARIIAEMGPVEGNGHTVSQEGSPKRLYRIKEGSMLWGVCTGLAAFFGIDVSLVRIVFVLLAIITGGGFCLAYFIMKLIIPEADTMQEKAAAHGDPFNAQELVARAKLEYERWSTQLAGEHERHHQWKHEMKQQRKEWRRASKSSMRPYRSNPIIGLIRGVISIVWIVALFTLIIHGTVLGWALPPGIPVWVAIIILFILYHAVTGPMKGSQGHHLGQNGLYEYQWTYTEWDGVTDGLTVLFLAVAFGWAYLHVPQFYFFVHHPIAGTKDVFHWVSMLLHR